MRTNYMVLNKDQSLFQLKICIIKKVLEIYGKKICGQNLEESRTEFLKPIEKKTKLATQ